MCSIWRFAGRTVMLYRLQNKVGTCAEIMNYGGIIHSLIFAGKNGISADIVMGYETFEDQLTQTGWNCGIIGRCVNRILNNELKNKYKALPTQDTVLNFSSHCYFNLGGHDSGTIADHDMQICADYYLPDGDNGVPAGEVLKVADTVFNFNHLRKLREGLVSDDQQIKLQGDYDYNYCLAGSGFRKVACVYEKKSGRCMTVYTDMPGVQLYTSCNHPSGSGYKGGAVYHKYDAFCLETQYYSNATAYSHFSSPVFPADRVFCSETVYAFSVK
jgi:aldose 1-epimerase